MQSKTETLNVRVTADMREAIRAAAMKDGESEGVLVRKALRVYFDNRDTTFLHKSTLAPPASEPPAVILNEPTLPFAQGAPTRRVAPAPIAPATDSLPKIGVRVTPPQVKL